MIHILRIEKLCLADANKNGADQFMHSVRSAPSLLFATPFSFDFQNFYPLATVVSLSE